jgi:hypothetical protein
VPLLLTFGADARRCHWRLLSGAERQALPLRTGAPGAQRNRRSLSGTAFAGHWVTERQALP